MNRFLDLTTIRERFSNREPHRITPYSCARTEFSYLLAFAITLGLILWIIFS